MGLKFSRFALEHDARTRHSNTALEHHVRCEASCWSSVFTTAVVTVSIFVFVVSCRTLLCGIVWFRSWDGCVPLLCGSSIPLYHGQQVFLEFIFSCHQLKMSTSRWGLCIREFTSIPHLTIVFVQLIPTLGTDVRNRFVILIVVLLNVLVSAGIWM